MRLQLSTPPAKVPLTWDGHVKTHLRVDSDEEKSRIMSITVPQALEWAESATNRALITQTWVLYLDGFPGQVWERLFEVNTYGKYDILIPKPPLQSVSGVTYVDTAGVTQTLSPSVYEVVAPNGPKAQNGRLRLRYNQIWPYHRAQSDAVAITFVCGYGADGASVPASLMQAMLLCVGEAYERREAGNELEITAVPMTAINLAVGYLAEAA